MQPLPLDSGFLLQNLMDHSSDAIYFKDRQSRFLMVNRACFEKHGWESAAAVKGRTDFDVFSKEHAEQAFADEQRIIETGEPLNNIEEKETWPDGSVTWVSTTKMPLKSVDGEIIGTFGISRDITARKEAELRARRYAEEVRLIKEEMEEEVRMAGELQKTFFPNSYPEFPEGSLSRDSCVEFLHHFKSCSDVSSDYCSIQRLSATEAGIFLCDVQGIGVRAALGTALIRGIVQDIAPLGLEPGAYLARMNQLLDPMLCQAEHSIDITACYLVVDVASGKVRLANAGHPTPIHIQQGRDAKWLFEDKTQWGPALALQTNATYQTIECAIDPGDGVVLFTDGLYTPTNSNGDLYGEPRLLSSAHSHSAESLAELFKSLKADASVFSSTGTFSDDVCLVGFQLNRLLG